MQQLVSNEVIYNPMEVVSFVNRHQITEAFHTYLFQNILSQIPPKKILSLMKSLRTVCLMAVLSKDLARRTMLCLQNVRFVNVYSISECHEVGAVDVSMLRLGDKEDFVCWLSCPLSPLYILDDNCCKSKMATANCTCLSLYLLASTKYEKDNSRGVQMNPYRKTMSMVAITVFTELEIALGCYQVVCLKFWGAAHSW